MQESYGRICKHKSNNELVSEQIQIVTQYSKHSIIKQIATPKAMRLKNTRRLV